MPTGLLCGPQSGLFPLWALISYAPENLMKTQTYELPWGLEGQQMRIQTFTKEPYFFR
jgi:hypothetical protein